MAAGAQGSYGSNAAPKAQTQSAPDDGLTPAQRASKKSAHPKANADAPAAATTSDAAPATAPAATASDSAAAATAPPAATAPSNPPAQAAATPSPSADQAQGATDDTQGGGAAKPATAADVKAGAAVYDSKGVAIGKIESVSGKNAVLASGSAKASVPISSFAKNGKGLMIAMTKSEFEAATKKQ
jgi:hypothetical protein